MVRVEAPPTDRTVPVVRALLLAVALTSAATVAGAALAAEAARIPLLWGGAAATVAIAALSVESARRRLAARTLEHEHAQRFAAVEQRLAAHDAETVRLAREIMPAAVYRLKHGESPDEVMRVLVDHNEEYRDLPRAQREILYNVLRIIDNEEAQREGAQFAFVGIARRVQAIVHQQASELREMEEDHGRNPEVFDDLLRIDHGNALIGRLADSIAVIGGTRPGRQWQNPVPLFSVLRGAMSRILEYPRVELHSIAKVAVVGPAVEPVIHACAELLDNATRYSPPQTRVHVTAVEVQSGVAIEIEDGGVSLSEESRRRAEGMLERAQEGADLNDLGESPRLGMAVVGRLCTMYNLKVSLRQSAYGGVRAVIIVPREIITTGPAPGVAHGIGAVVQPGPDGTIARPERSHGRPPRTTPGPRRAKPAAPAPAAAAPSPMPPMTVPSMSMSMEDDVPVVTEWTDEGLPQRRSRLRTQFDTPAPPAPRGPELPARHARPAEGAEKKEEPQPGIWLEAFTKAANGVPQEPSAVGESGESWDKGDLS